MFAQRLLTQIFRLTLPTLVLGVAALAPASYAWDAAGRFDNQGNYLDPVTGHSAACLRYESGFVAPATIGGLVNGLEVEQRTKAQLADARPGQAANGKNNPSSVITIEPNVIPSQRTTHWMIHTHNGHLMIGSGQQ